METRGPSMLTWMSSLRTPGRSTDTAYLSPLSTTSNRARTAAGSSAVRSGTVQPVRLKKSLKSSSIREPTGSRRVIWLIVFSPKVRGARPRTTRQMGLASANSSAATPRRPYFLHDFGEFVDVLEAAVDGGEPYVGDLVQPLQLAHHQLAQLLALDFALRRGQQLVLDPADRIIDRLARHRALAQRQQHRGDRKSTRLNSSHGYISYAVFCLKKKKTKKTKNILKKKKKKKNRNKKK